ncbi:ALP1-like protein [Tanacetum coccineum]
MARPLFKLIVNEVTNHEENHGFPGMLGSLNCTDWEWFGYPNAFKGQYVRRDHAPKIPCVANDVTYPWGYYLVDGIYPKLATLIKTIPELADDDNKRILYKLKQESARKDLERAFGVLKKKLAILANPARALKKERIKKMVYTCIILHNMIRKFKGVAISPTWFLEEAHKPDDLERSAEQVQQVMRHIRSAQAHQNLRADLVEHLSRNYEAEFRVPFTLRHCWEDLRKSLKLWDTEAPKFGAKKKNAKRSNTFRSSSFNTESGDASINFNVDAGDVDKDEVWELQRPIGRDKAKGSKKKGAGSSRSSSSMNDEALARLMVSELARHNERATEIKKEERLAFLEI